MNILVVGYIEIIQAIRGRFERFNQPKKKKKKKKKKPTRA